MVRIVGKMYWTETTSRYPKKYGYYDGNWARWGGLDSDAQRRKTVEKNSAKIVDSFIDEGA
jgi:hypothetical protein